MSTRSFNSDQSDHPCHVYFIVNFFSVTIFTWIINVVFFVVYALWKLEKITVLKTRIRVQEAMSIKRRSSKTRSSRRETQNLSQGTYKWRLLNVNCRLFTRADWSPYPTNSYCLFVKALFTLQTHKEPLMWYVVNPILCPILKRRIVNCCWCFPSFCNIYS